MMGESGTGTVFLTTISLHSPIHAPTLREEYVKDSQLTAGGEDPSEPTSRCLREKQKDFFVPRCGADTVISSTSDRLQISV